MRDNKGIFHKIILDGWKSNEMKIAVFILSFIIFITVFSSIREPLFTKSPGPNFQDRLFDWWKEVSNNFNKTAEEYVLMNGTDLFAALIRTRIGSVQINPAGPIGGELYRHEVETVAEGGRILRLRAEAESSVH